MKLFQKAAYPSSIQENLGFELHFHSCIKNKRKLVMHSQKRAKKGSDRKSSFPKTCCFSTIYITVTYLGLHGKKSEFLFFNTKLYCNYGIIPWICGISKIYPFRLPSRRNLNFVYPKDENTVFSSDRQAKYNFVEPVDENA